MAGEWKLTIEFRDMFFLAHHPAKGAVVLLPRARKPMTPGSGHSAVLWIDDPKFSYGLYRAQVNIADANKQILWGSPCKRVQNSNLLSANDLFGRFSIATDLIQQIPTPRTLNARVVLGGGTLTDKKARNRHARFEWNFTNRNTSQRHNLTDRLLYEVVMPAGDATLIITRDEDDFEHIPLTGEDHDLVIWNRDLRHVTEEEADLPAGMYELEEYAHLHALIGKEAEKVHPVGFYPDGKSHDSSRTRPISNDEPICGGEEGEPDPPPEPTNP
jgi:hypothetical protein